jgi:anaerobic selenocysteine-containing dehydrogenase
VHCRICPAGCGILVDVDDSGNVAGITGDPADPLSEGYTCAKGRAGGELHHGADRLDQPLVRQGGRLRPATWEAALDLAAAIVGDLTTRHGRDAVGVYRSTGWAFDPAGAAASNAFFRGLGTTQQYSSLSIDCPSKYLVPQLVAGVGLVPQPDLPAARLLIIIGENTVVSHGHTAVMAGPIRKLRAVQRAGGRIAVIDPRRTETARLADWHLPTRPGSDPALLAHLVRRVLHQGPDRAYLGACAEPGSLATLARLVEPWTRDATAAACDVAADLIDALADEVIRAGRVALESGTGTTMNAAGNVTEWLLWALGAVTGALDRPGGSRFNPGLLRPLEDALPADRSAAAPPARSRPDLPRLGNGELACAVLADEIDAGHLRALWVLGGNPALLFPDAARVRAALGRLDALIVADIRRTETTELATVVLPLAGQFERADVHTGYLLTTPYVRYSPAVVAPGGQRRPMWRVFTDIGARLGIDVFAGLARAKGRDLETDDVLAAIATRARVPWEQIRAAPKGVIGDPLGPGWLIPGRLPHRLDLAPDPLIAQFGRWRDGLPTAGELTLIGRRLANRTNSLRPPVASRAGRGSTATLLMHPADAAARGIRSGDTVTVSSRQGQLSANAEVTDAIRSGVVSLPHGATEPDVNLLTSAEDADPLTGMPVLSGFAVLVKRAAGQAE